MSISHVYKGHVIVRRTNGEHEVEGMTRRFPNEDEARRAVDREIAEWLAGYDRSPPVDTTR